MATKTIIPSQTALLLLDLQVLHAADPTMEALIHHTASVIELCRSKGMFPKFQLRQKGAGNRTISDLW